MPVHPQDQHLLGCSWEDQIYLDTALPFGLRSTPKLISAVADTLAWAMLSSRVQYLLHYLDDFLILGSPSLAQCHEALHKALQVCSTLGIPVVYTSQDSRTYTDSPLPWHHDRHTTQRQLKLLQEKFVVATTPPSKMVLQERQL